MDCPISKYSHWEFIWPGDKWNIWKGEWAVLQNKVVIFLQNFHGRTYATLYTALYFGYSQPVTTKTVSCPATWRASVAAHVNLWKISPSSGLFPLLYTYAQVSKQKQNKELPRNVLPSNDWDPPHSSVHKKLCEILAVYRPYWIHRVILLTLIQAKLSR